MCRLFLIIMAPLLVVGCGGTDGSQDEPRLYVARKNDETKAPKWQFEAFAIDSITGQLERLNVRIDRGGERYFQVEHLLMHPDGERLVLGKRGSFGAMSIDGDGGLTLLPKEQTDHRGYYDGQGAVALHPDGRRIFIFSLPSKDSSAGTWVLKMNDAPPLFEMVGEVSTPGCLGYSAVFDAEGSYLYCGSHRGEDLLTLGVDGTTGALTNIVKIPVKQFVRALRSHPSGEFVYALSGELLLDLSQRRDWNNWRPSWIAGYRRNPRNGHLSPVIRGAVRVDSMVSDIAVTPDGRFLYAADRTFGRVLGFRITETGQLDQLAKWSRAGKAPANLAVDPSSCFVYVANTAGESLSLFSILDSGDLAPMSSSPIELGGAPTATLMMFP